MEYWIFLSIFLPLAGVGILSCRGKERSNLNPVPLEKVADLPKASLECLAKKRVFFGHQSVGYNIVDGIIEVIREDKLIELNIAESDSPGGFRGPIFTHSNIGKNEDPSSKCAAFGELIGKIHNDVDIALFKFCYVDINERTDVESVFREYDSLIGGLRKKYPRIRFVHVTVPLKAAPMDFKTKVKRLIGYPHWVDDANIRRNEFNRLLRERNNGKEPVFDLEEAESTRPDGSRSTFMKNGKSYLALASEFTDDGGHLNRLGRRHVAEQFLIALAKVACENEGKR